MTVPALRGSELQEHGYTASADGMVRPRDGCCSGDCRMMFEHLDFHVSPPAPLAPDAIARDEAAAGRGRLATA
ncbi:hypothetical protein [Rhodanobacter sp. UC4451_H18]